MEYEIQTQQIHREEYPPLTVRTAIPLMEDCSAAEDFYRALAESCVIFCKERFFAHLPPVSAEAGACLAYRYSMSATVTYEDKDCVGVRLSVILRELQSGTRLYAFGDGQVWDRKDGRMLSPKEVFRRWSAEESDPKLLRKKSGLFPEGGLLKQWRDGAFQVVCRMRE